MSSEKKISDLNPVPSLDNTALYEIEQGGISFKVALSEMNPFLTGITSINADTTDAQLLTGQTNKILIADDLVGNHTFTIGTDIVTLTDAQALTNKIVDADLNTITNIGSGEIKSELITGQTPKATPVDADEILISDSAAAGALKKITLTALLAGGAQTPWGQDIVADGFDLNDLSNILFRSTTGAPAATDRAIWYDDAIGMRFNALTGDLFRFDVNGVSQLTINDTTIDFEGNTLTDILDITSITSLNGVAIGNYATSSDNLSFFAATTSLQLLGVMSDETGTGLLVFNDTPTIITPTIASFVNATHDHEAAAGGGQLDSTLALSDTANIAYLNTANVYTAGTRQDFLGLLAGTAGLNVGGIAGNPTTQVDGDVWYNSTSNTLFGRVNGANVDLGQSGAEVFVWTANHDANGFALEDARFADDTDNTKILDLNLVGMTTGIVGTLDFNFTTAKTITFPDATTTMVGTGIVDQLTNTELTSGVFAKITGLGAQSQTLDMNTQILQFVDANQTIQNNAGNLFYDVATGQVHLWRINNVTEMQLSATALAMQGNAILQVGFLTSNATTPASAGAIRLGNTELVAWRNFGNTADITLGVSASDELELNGAPLVLEDNGLKLENPAGTFNYTIQAAAIGANRILNLPLITATDTLMTLGLAQTVSGALTLSSILTMSGVNVDLAGNDLDNIQNLIHDISTSGTDVDFNEDQLQVISIAANTTFTGVNYAIGKSKTIFITTDATLRTLTFPAGWVFQGAKPADQAASKVGTLTLTCISSIEAGVRCAYAVEE